MSIRWKSKIFKSVDLNYFHKNIKKFPHTTVLVSTLILFYFNLNCIELEEKTYFHLNTSTCTIGAYVIGFENIIDTWINCFVNPCGPISLTLPRYFKSFGTLGFL